ncbi:MAG TPA: TIM barrel protein, partial [Cyclobacteriaceae bacterium]
MRRIIFLISLIVFTTASSSAQKKPEIGIAQPFEKDSLVNAMGYHYMVETVAKALLPADVTDVQLSQHLQKMKSLKTKLYAVNVFIPGSIKVVGPEVSEVALLSYVEIVFEHARAAGVDMIVWGSGGSRRVPDGFDKEKAKEQFIANAKKVAVLARKYKITLALENLNSGETNFINTLQEALDVVKKVDHPN